MLLAAGCGGSGDQADAPASYGNPSVEPTEPTTTTTTTLQPERQPSAEAPSTNTSREVAGRAPAGIAETGAANRTTRQDPSGFYLSLTADTGGEDGGGAALFELGFENRGSSTLFYDSNQELFFAMFDAAGSVAWDSLRCRPAGDSSVGGVLRLEPGEAGRFVERYPSTAGDGRCAVPPGTYRLLGYIDWCPPSSIVTTAGPPYCDRSKVVRLESAALEIDVEAS